MANNFKSLILDALNKVDTAGVTSHTDLLSTTYQGTTKNVFGALQQIFSGVNDGKTHITMEATLTPGGGDQHPQALNFTKTTVNQSFFVHGKIAIYPLGTTDFQVYVTQLIKMSKLRKIYLDCSQHGVDFHGAIDEVFDFFREIYEYTTVRLDDFAIGLSLSVNSPSLQSVSK